jgi:ferredoxin-NADP reductase
MPEYLFPLKDRREVAKGTMAFWFDTSSAPDFTFEPGQNADYYLINPPYTDAEGNKRSFSFAASPHHRGTIMITTRMRDTAFKNSLKEIPLGTPVKVVGPLGNMILHDDVTRPAVMLAGGIGITPFRSMIEWATVEKKQYRLFLFSSNRDKSSIAFHNDLEIWTDKNFHFHYLPTLTDEKPADWHYATGPITMPMIQEQLDDLSLPVFYMAGPDAFVLAMRRMLMNAGIGRDQIRQEAFTGY